MQLCVGVEFLFILAKPSKSFQNLTETPPLKRGLLSSFCFPKLVKMATKNENRLTNKTFTPKNDRDYKFFSPLTGLENNQFWLNDDSYRRCTRKDRIYKQDMPSF